MLIENKKRLICMGLLLTFVVMSSGCFGAKTNDTGSKITSQSGTSGKISNENLVRCPLSGDMVPKETIERRPLAVMVENSPAARPQSGLDKADIVYEALAEGAVTRFMAVFLHGDTSVLGPVRSARPYYIERMFEYDAMYAYCGGSEAAKQMIKSEGVASLDEFRVGRQAYRRVKGRKAPHNLYANTNKLRAVGEKKGYAYSGKLPKFEFLEAGQENEGGISAENLLIKYPTKSSIVRWTYDAHLKKYLRFEAGAPHYDAVTGKQLTGSNIIVQYVKTKVIDKAGRRETTMIGEGKAVMFTGGKAYTGRWIKEDMRAQTYFYSDNGQILKFNEGQTWIEVVPTTTKIQY